MTDFFQNRREFLELIDDVRKSLGYAIRQEDQFPGEELAMEMMYGGFEFAVAHSIKNKPEKILLECRFGEMPAGMEQAIMYQLLHMNATLAELDGSVFCIDPDTLDVMYTIAVNLRDLNGIQLLGKMTEIVWHGRRWLENRFIQTESRTNAPSLNPAVLA